MCPMNCHPTLCGMLVDVEDGRVIRVSGDVNNPDRRGFLCVRGQASPEILDNPRRLLYPMVRSTRRSPWRRATWDEVLDRITAAMRAAGREAVATWPGHGIFANNYGTRIHSHLLRRFSNLYGCQWWSPAIICWALGGFGLGLTGLLEPNTKEDMGAHANFIVLWGANLASQPNTARHLTAARRRGARVVVHLESHTPAWAAPITGIAAERIVALAHRYATTRPAMIVVGGSSMHKASNGWHAARAIACLPALTGQVGVDGGGLGPRPGPPLRG